MVLAGFEGASGGVHVFICVVSVVTCDGVTTMRRLCELGCVAGILFGFVCSVVGM